MCFRISLICIIVKAFALELYEMRMNSFQKKKKKVSPNFRRLLSILDLFFLLIHFRVIAIGIC
jgi:hypothetical protein